MRTSSFDPTDTRSPNLAGDTSGTRSDDPYRGKRSTLEVGSVHKGRWTDRGSPGVQGADDGRWTAQETGRGVPRPPVTLDFGQEGWSNRYDLCPRRGLT